MDVFLLCKYGRMSQNLFLREFYWRRLEGMEVPLLSWGVSRDRVNLDDILVEEKSIHGKVYNSVFKFFFLYLLIYFCSTLMNLF